MLFPNDRNLVPIDGAWPALFLGNPSSLIISAPDLLSLAERLLKQPDDDAEAIIRRVADRGRGFGDDSGEVTDRAPVRRS